MFPQGGPGVGLLLLRVSVAAMFLTNSPHPGAALVSHLVFAITLLIVALLAIGFLTPITSVAVAIVGIVNLVLPHQQVLPHVFLISDAAALTLLGPGAYSLDSRLFGRRVLVVRPRRSTDSP
jgi:uncharacterized membrane protein YphA (DoxX/SURF4 family)